MKNIKLFYADWYNINDTYNLFPAYLKHFNDFQTINVNDKKYEDIKKELASTAFLILDHSIFAAGKYQKNKTINLYMKKYKGNDFYESIWNLLVNAKCKKVYIASGWDLHWTSLEQSEEVIKSFDGIAWMFEKKPTAFLDIPENFRDSWMFSHRCPLENWNVIRKGIPSRFELTHFISNKSKKKFKVWDITVPGVTYQTRATFKQKIIQDKTISMAPYDKLLTIGNLILSDQLRYANIRFRKQLQEFLVSHSKLTFVCGSGYNYPVRKFFEVAVSNSLLLALPFNGFSDFGFIKDKNCIVADLSDPQKQVKDLLKSDKYINLLSNNLQRDIFSKHNIHKRSLEFIKFIKHMYNDQNVVAEFKNGEFEYFT